MKHLYAAAKLLEAAGIAQVGVNLFVGTIPADVPSGVMLRDMLDGIQIDEGMAGTYVDQFQLIARDPDTKESYDLAERAAATLKVHNLAVDDVYFTRMFPLTKPVSFPRGDDDGVESAVRMRFICSDIV